MKKKKTAGAGQIKLSADGVWFDGTVAITHQRTISLFFKSVYEENGCFFLKGDKKPVPVVVEDVAYFVTGLELDGTAFKISLSDGSQETLDITSLDVGAENQLYCRVKVGKSRARFERKVYYELMKHLDVRDGYYGLLVGDVFYPVQSVAGAERTEPQKDLPPPSPPKKRAAKGHRSVKKAEVKTKKKSRQVRIKRSKAPVVKKRPAKKSSPKPSVKKKSVKSKSKSKNKRKPKKAKKR